VQLFLLRIDRGYFAEAVIRIASAFRHIDFVRNEVDD